MTYCVAMRLEAGLVFLSDSRTNAGVDQIGTFRKMNVFENPGDRMMVIMTAGNLSISQSIRQIVSEYLNADGVSIWTAQTMHEAAQIVGECIRVVHQRDAKSLEQFGIDFNVSIIFGGQIKANAADCFSYMQRVISLNRIMKILIFKLVKQNMANLLLIALLLQPPL